MRTSIEHGSEEYDFVAKKFYTTVTHYAYRIIGVDKIRNVERAGIFDLKKLQIQRRLGT